MTEFGALVAIVLTGLVPVCAAAQVLQDKAKQLEAAASTAGAAADASMCDLRIQLEAERTEARRARMEASSTVKQLELLVQRLRREADASKQVALGMACLQQAWDCVQAVTSLGAVLRG